MVVKRNQLLATCSDVQFLTLLYKQQLASLGQEPHHAHLRYVPFDPTLRLPANKDLDYFVSKSREDSGSSERCGVGPLRLAVNELDDKQVGSASFRSREDIDKVGVALFTFLAHSHTPYTLTDTD